MKYALLFLLFFIVGCAAQTHDTVRIGALIPGSAGYGAQNGENALKGYQLAIDDINAHGGIDGKKLELIVADYKGDDPAAAISAYQSLKMQGIQVMLGPNHGPTAQAVAPIACQDHTLLFSGAVGVRDFAQACDETFNTWPADYENSKMLGKLVANGGYSRIAVVGSQQSWELEQAQGVKQGIEEVNGTIVEYVILQDELSDFQAEATKIMAAKPDAVIFTNYGYMPQLAKRLRGLGYSGQFFTVVLDESRKAPAQGAFEGTIAVTSYTPTDAFKEKFLHQYGKNPDFPADTSYDAFMLIAQAMQETHSTNVATLVGYLKGVKQYSGMSGNFTFDQYGGALKQPAFTIVQNDQIVPYTGTIQK